MIEKGPDADGVETRTVSWLWPEDGESTTAGNRTVKRMDDADTRGGS